MLSKKNKLFWLILVFFSSTGIFGFFGKTYAYPACCMEGYLPDCQIGQSPCELVGNFTSPSANFLIEVGTPQPVTIYIGSSTSLLDTVISYRFVNFQNQYPGANKSVQIIARDKSSGNKPSLTINANSGGFGDGGLIFPDGGLTIDTSTNAPGKTGGAVSIYSYGSTSYPTGSDLKIYTYSGQSATPLSGGGVNIRGSAGPPYENFIFGANSIIKTGTSTVVIGGAINIQNVGSFIGPFGLLDSSSNYKAGNITVNSDISSSLCVSYGAHAVGNILINTALLSLYGSTYFPPWNGGVNAAPIESGPSFGVIWLGSVPSYYRFIDLASSTVSGMTLGSLSVYTGGLSDKSCISPGACYQDLADKIKTVSVNCSGLCSNSPINCFIPIYDTGPPSAQITARDKYNNIIGATTTGAAAATATFASFAYDGAGGSGLSDHKVLWSKNGGATSTVDCGANTNCWVRVGSAAVSFSTTSGAVWVDCLGNPACQNVTYGFLIGDAVAYKSMAVDNASYPGPNTTSTAEQTFLVVNSPPVATNPSVSQGNYCGVSSPPIYLSWNFSDPDGDSQSAYQVQTATNLSFSPTTTDSGIVSYSSTTNVPIGLSYGTTYYWRVRVWDSYGAPSAWATDTVGFTTDDHPYPKPDFGWSPQKPPVGVITNFTSSSSCYDTAGTTTCSVGTGDLFFWIFQDGNPATSLLQNPTTTFSSLGAKSATSTVTDSSGFSCSRKKTINASPRLPEWKEIPPF